MSFVGSLFSYVNDARSQEPQTKVGLPKIGQGRELIGMVYNRDKWGIILNTVMNLQVP